MKTLQFLTLSLVLAIAHGLTSSVPGNTRPDGGCKNLSKPVQLRATQRYGIFGDDEFDTVVCGYLVTRLEKVWDETLNVAYFRVTQFGQPGFQQAIAQGINQGNTVNALRSGQYELNLGCFDKNRITGHQYDPKTPYITPATQAQLLNSSVTQPVAIVLSFGKHPGSHCTCCNLAEALRSL
jgi:hypothetical protein